jgi:predicted cupin superfamily sugar epimerase
MQDAAAAGNEWVQRLALLPHPEGGWFRRIYTAAQSIETAGGARPAASSIYYLLTQQQPIGRMHCNRSDILHFLIDGGPLEYWLLDEAGTLSRQRLAQQPGAERFLLVRGGCWKASQLVDGATHALIAEVVTPGFDFADHRFATSEDLQQRWPQHGAALAAFVQEG